MAKTVPAHTARSAPRRRMARQSIDLVDTIRSMIINLELPPGAVVSESQLMKQLGCGRTPVREALLILSNEYLINQVPGMGSTVAGLDITDYTLITELQEALEPFAARLAATHISDVELDQLEAIVAEAKTGCRGQRRRQAGADEPSLSRNRRHRVTQQISGRCEHAPQSVLGSVPAFRLLPGGPRATVHSRARANSASPPQPRSRRSGEGLLRPLEGLADQVPGEGRRPGNGASTTRRRRKTGKALSRHPHLDAYTSDERLSLRVAANCFHYGQATWTRARKSTSTN